MGVSNGVTNPNLANNMGTVPSMGPGISAPTNNSFIKPQQYGTPLVSPAGSMPRNASTPNLDSGKRDPFADLGKS